MASPSTASGKPQQQDTRTEKQKLLAGELHYAFADEELLAERQHAKQLIAAYNQTTQLKERTELLQQLLGSMDADDPPFIEPPLFCDYGYSIHIGSGTYFNIGCTILDGCKVDIGSRLLFGPNVQVYSATHTLDGHVRQGSRGPEYAKPVTVGDDVWVGGAAILCPGITIGNNSVVGAGSVVTRDVQPYTGVAGNPARVIRHLERPDNQQQQQQGGAAAALPN